MALTKKRSKQTLKMLTIAVVDLWLSERTQIRSIELINIIIIIIEDLMIALVLFFLMNSLITTKIDNRQ